MVYQFGFFFDIYFTNAGCLSNLNLRLLEDKSFVWWKLKLSCRTDLFLGKKIMTLSMISCGGWDAYVCICALDFRKCSVLSEIPNLWLCLGFIGGDFMKIMVKYEVWLPWYFIMLSYLCRSLKILVMRELLISWQCSCYPYAPLQVQEFVLLLLAWLS